MRVIISGTSEGIGKAIAEKFLETGHEVYGYDINESAISHPLYRHTVHDIRDKLESAPEDAEILINCAGTFDNESAIDINLNGTIRFTEHFKESKKLRSILFIASASARNGAEFPLYVASKAGIVGYMKNLAMYLGSEKGVTVNSVSPGGVITSSNRHIIENESMYDAVKSETILRKWADPSEIADLAYYLTVINRSVTGEDILIDNGEMLKSNFIW